MKFEKTHLFPVSSHVVQRNAEHIAQDGFAGIESVLRLLKIVGFGAVVHVERYLVDAGQRMKDAQVGTGVIQHLVALVGDVLFSFVRHAVERARGTRVW